MERLELLLAYLRRVLCFDFGSGQQYKDAAALLKEGGELHLGARLCVHQPPPEARMAPFASAPRLGPPAAAAFLDELLKLLAEFDRLDDEYEGLSNEAGEAFISKNCVEEEPGKRRCPLSGKLFKEPMYVRKHIENKHTERLLAAKAAPLGEKYRRYFVAEIPLIGTQPPPPPAPPPAAYLKGGRGGRGGRGGGDWDGFGGKGKGKGGGWDDGFGKGRGGRGGRGGGGGGGGWGGDWGGGDCARRRPTGRRRPAPPRSGGRRGRTATSTRRTTTTLFS